MKTKQGKVKATIEVEGAAGPTRTGVEKVIRELEQRYPGDEEYDRLYREYDDLRDRLIEQHVTNNPELVKLKEAKDKACSNKRMTRTEWKRKVERVRLMYFSRGFVPDVVKAVQELVKDREDFLNGKKS